MFSQRKAGGLDEVNKIEAEKVAQMAVLLISKASGCIIS